MSDTTRCAWRNEYNMVCGKPIDDVRHDVEAEGITPYRHAFVPMTERAEPEAEKPTIKAAQDFCEAYDRMRAQLSSQPRMMLHAGAGPTSPPHSETPRCAEQGCVPVESSQPEAGAPAGFNPADEGDRRGEWPKGFADDPAPASPSAQQSAATVPSDTELLDHLEAVLRSPRGDWGIDFFGERGGNGVAIRIRCTALDLYGDSIRDVLKKDLTNG